jgi:hypothetical protein
MSDRASFLLSPYRLPTTHQVLLNEEEMAAWLNGYIILWHPALLHGAKGPPQIATPYDHEMPETNQVFAVPESPPLFQPEDWPERVRNAGALHFKSAADRAATVANLRRAIEEVRGAGDHFASEETSRLLDLAPEQVRPFFGVGFGYLMVETLFDAMEHEHLLAVDDFWNEVRQAIAALLQPDGAPEVTRRLREAAGRLLSAREVLYPIAIHLLDIALFDGPGADFHWPTSSTCGLPLNLIIRGELLEQLAVEAPERLQALRGHLSSDASPPLLEVCDGSYRDREDALLPLESQLWNLRKGRHVCRELLGADVAVFARKRSSFHPQTPQWLQAAGMRHALLLNFDNAIIPNHRTTVVNWSAPNGRSIDAFTRMPLPARTAQTFFNLVYSLHQSISQDTAPTLALLHRGQRASSLYDDWLALSELAPVLGNWTTFSRYFGDALAGEYVGSTNADEFFADYLEERINAHRPDPVSAFARQARTRRQLDSAWTLAAMYRGLQTAPATEAERKGLTQLAELEDTIEGEGLDVVLPAEGEANPRAIEPTAVIDEWAKRLVDRLQARSAEGEPGYVLINPCNFTRRVALETDWPGGPIAVEGPVKAAQFDDGAARLVVEVPPLGFAWVPRGRPGTPAPKPRMQLADSHVVRNEFFEAEVDPETGGLRGIRDPRTRVNRVGQQLVFNPGSRMQARSVRTTVNGAALGVVVSEGVILSEQNEELATFRQHFRAWLGRPVLELHIQIEPKHIPTGYPWHSYYAARFAWRDERTAIIRGVNGTGTFTNHTRPQSPEYIELRRGRTNTVLFPGGLPFHQRQGARMLDVLLVPEGERCQDFYLGLALDREHPIQSAVGMISPVVMVPTTKGPPPGGPSGWLYHIDAPHLLLTCMRPYEQVGGPTRSFIAHLLETTGVHGGSATLRCVRNPVRAMILDGNDAPATDLNVEGDGVAIDFSAGDLLRVRVDFD